MRNVPLKRILEKGRYNVIVSALNNQYGSNQLFQSREQIEGGAIVGLVERRCGPTFYRRQISEGGPTS